MKNYGIEKITERGFFTCPAEELAQKLIGKVLCHKIDGETLSFMITETEAYGKDDPYTHSNNYKTGNGVVMQNKQGGTIYVHENKKDGTGTMFDIVSGKEGEGEGVLIRNGIDLDTLNQSGGPMLLGKEIKMSYENNGKDLLISKDIWLGEIKSISIDEKKVIKKTRIGLGIPESDSEEKKRQKEKYIDKELNFSLCACSIEKIKDDLSKENQC